MLTGDQVAAIVVSDENKQLGIFVQKPSGFLRKGKTLWNVTVSQVGLVP